MKLFNISANIYNVDWDEPEWLLQTFELVKCFGALLELG
jgi:hypothetical protein